MKILISMIAVMLATMTNAVEFTCTIDSGGQRAASASYTMDGSLGGIIGISTGGGDTARNGYIGQLTEVVSLSATGTPTQVNEGANSQLSGTAVMDDDTVTALTGSDIAWNTPIWPIQSISASGVAAAAAVYGNTAAPVNGQYLGVSGSGSLLVLDSLPDNYGSYASDGLPDSWQNQYFGLNNPDAAPGIDLFGMGENNLFKYTAGLDPTNAASFFSLQIESVAAQPSWGNLVFSPRWTDRTYTPQFRTNLISGSWTTLTETNVTDNINERTVTDLGANEARKFYRIQISYP